MLTRPRCWPSTRLFVNKASMKGLKLKDYGSQRRTVVPRDEPMGIRYIPPPKPPIVVEPADDELIGWGTAPKKVASSGARESETGQPQVWTPGDDDLDKRLVTDPWMVAEKQPKTKKTKRKKAQIVKKPKLVPHDRLSQTVSAELGAPLGRIYGGVRPDQTTLALHSVALSNPTRATLNGLELLKSELLAKGPKSGRSGLKTRMPVAAGSLYDAVARSLDAEQRPKPVPDEMDIDQGPDEARLKDDAMRLRDAVVDTAIARLALEDDGGLLAEQPITAFVADHGVSVGDLAVGLTQNKTWLVLKQPPKVDVPFGPFNPDFDSVALPPDFQPEDQVRGLHARQLATRLIATHLGRPLHIYSPKRTTPMVEEPFPSGEEPGEPLALNLRFVADDRGQKRWTFSPRP